MIDNTKVLTVQTCELELPVGDKTRTGNEIVNDLQYELCDLYCSSHSLATFAKLRKANVSFIMSVRPSAWNNSERIFMKFDI
jgi:hypothetical protein